MQRENKQEENGVRDGRKQEIHLDKNNNSTMNGMEGEGSRKDSSSCFFFAASSLPEREPMTPTPSSSSTTKESGTSRSLRSEFTLSSSNVNPIMSTNNNSNDDGTTTTNTTTNNNNDVHQYPSPQSFQHRHPHMAIPRTEVLRYAAVALSIEGPHEVVRHPSGEFDVDLPSSSFSSSRAPLPPAALLAAPSGALPPSSSTVQPQLAPYPEVPLPSALDGSSSFADYPTPRHVAVAIETEVTGTAGTTNTKTALMRKTTTVGYGVPSTIPTTVTSDPCSDVTPPPSDRMMERPNRQKEEEGERKKTEMEVGEEKSTFFFEKEEKVVKQGHAERKGGEHNDDTSRVESGCNRSAGDSSGCMNLELKERIEGILDLTLPHRNSPFDPNNDRMVDLMIHNNNPTATSGSSNGTNSPSVRTRMHRNELLMKEMLMRHGPLAAAASTASSEALLWRTSNYHNEDRVDGDAWRPSGACSSTGSFYPSPPPNAIRPSSCGTRPSPRMSGWPSRVSAYSIFTSSLVLRRRGPKGEEGGGEGEKKKGRGEGDEKGGAVEKRSESERNLPPLPPSSSSSTSPCDPRQLHHPGSSRSKGMINSDISSSLYFRPASSLSTTSPGAPAPCCQAVPLSPSQRQLEMLFLQGRPSRRLHRAPPRPPKSTANATSHPPSLFGPTSGIPTDATVLPHALQEEEEKLGAVFAPARVADHEEETRNSASPSPPSPSPLPFSLSSSFSPPPLPSFLLSLIDVGAGVLNNTPIDILFPRLSLSASSEETAARAPSSSSSSSAAPICSSLFFPNPPDSTSLARRRLEHHIPQHSLPEDIQTKRKEQEGGGGGGKEGEEEKQDKKDTDPSHDTSHRVPRLLSPACPPSFSVATKNLATPTRKVRCTLRMDGIEGTQWLVVFAMEAAEGGRGRRSVDGKSSSGGGGGGVISFNGEDFLVEENTRVGARNGVVSSCGSESFDLYAEKNIPMSVRHTETSAISSSPSSRPPEIIASGSAPSTTATTTRITSSSSASSRSINPYRFQGHVIRGTTLWKWKARQCAKKDEEVEKKEKSGEQIVSPSLPRAFPPKIFLLPLVEGYDPASCSSSTRANKKNVRTGSSSVEEGENGTTPSVVSPLSLLQPPQSSSSSSKGAAVCVSPPSASSCIEEEKPFLSRIIHPRRWSPRQFMPASFGQDKQGRIEEEKKDGNREVVVGVNQEKKKKIVLVMQEDKEEKEKENNKEEKDGIPQPGKSTSPPTSFIIHPSPPPPSSSLSSSSCGVRWKWTGLSSRYQHSASASFIDYWKRYCAGLALYLALGAAGAVGVEDIPVLGVGRATWGELLECGEGEGGGRGSTMMRLALLQNHGRGGGSGASSTSAWIKRIKYAIEHKNTAVPVMVYREMKRKGKLHMLPPLPVEKKAVKVVEKKMSSGSAAGAAAAALEEGGNEKSILNTSFSASASSFNCNPYFANLPAASALFSDQGKDEKEAEVGEEGGYARKEEKEERGVSVSAVAAAVNTTSEAATAEVLAAKKLAEKMNYGTGVGKKTKMNEKRQGDEEKDLVVEKEVKNKKKKSSFPIQPFVELYDFTDAELFQLYYFQLVMRAFFDVRIPSLSISSSDLTSASASSHSASSPEFHTEEKVEEGVENEPQSSLPSFYLRGDRLGTSCSAHRGFVFVTPQTTVSFPSDEDLSSREDRNSNGEEKEEAEGGVAVEVEVAKPENVHPHSSHNTTTSRTAEGLHSHNCIYFPPGSSMLYWLHYEAVIPLYASRRELESTAVLPLFGSPPPSPSPSFPSPALTAADTASARTRTTLASARTFPALLQGSGPLFAPLQRWASTILVDSPYRAAMALQALFDVASTVYGEKIDNILKSTGFTNPTSTPLPPRVFFCDRSHVYDFLVSHAHPFLKRFLVPLSHFIPSSTLRPARGRHQPLLRPVPPSVSQEKKKEMQIISPHGGGKEEVEPGANPPSPLLSVAPASLVVEKTLKEEKEEKVEVKKLEEEEKKVMNDLQAHASAQLSSSEPPCPQLPSSSLSPFRLPSITAPLSPIALEEEQDQKESEEEKQEEEVMQVGKEIVAEISASPFLHLSCPTSPFTRQESLVSRMQQYALTGSVEVFDGTTLGLEIVRDGVPLGHGGSGVVYQGIYGPQRLPVAVKVFIIPDGIASHEAYVRVSLSDVAFYVLLNQVDDAGMGYTGRAHDFVVSGRLPKGLPPDAALTLLQRSKGPNAKLCYFISDLMDGTLGRFLKEGDDGYDPEDWFDTIKNSPLRPGELFQFLYMQLVLKAVYNWKLLDLMLNGDLRGDNIGIQYLRPVEEREESKKKKEGGRGGEETTSVADEEKEKEGEGEEEKEEEMKNKKNSHTEDPRRYYKGILIGYHFSPDEPLRFLHFSADKNGQVDLRFILFMDVGQGMQPEVQVLSEMGYIGETIVSSCIQDDGLGRFWPLDELYCRGVEIQEEGVKRKKRREVKKNSEKEDDKQKNNGEEKEESTYFSCQEVLNWGSHLHIHSRDDARAAIRELFELYEPFYGLSSPLQKEEMTDQLVLVWGPEREAELRSQYVYASLVKE